MTLKAFESRRKMSDLQRDPLEAPVRRRCVGTGRLFLLWIELAHGSTEEVALGGL